MKCDMIDELSPKTKIVFESFLFFCISHFEVSKQFSSMEFYQNSLFLCSQHDCSFYFNVVDPDKGFGWEIV